MPQDPAPEHETLESELDDAPEGSGAVCSVHVDPFQISARARPFWLPTATQSVAVIQDTPLSCEDPVKEGVGSIVQVVPFQSSATVVGSGDPPSGLTSQPTALQKALVTHETEVSSFSPSAGSPALGTCCRAQLVPFHDAARE